MPIPGFQTDGNLPPGTHEATLEEVEQALCWNSVRRQLFDGLEKALGNMASAGVKSVWIAGGFASAKEEPKDIDGCWEYDSSVAVGRLDPVFLDLVPPREAMKRKYGVDLLIAGARLRDPQAKGKTVQEFFQEDRDGNPRGIVLLRLEPKK